MGQIDLMVSKIKFYYYFIIIVIIIILGLLKCHIFIIAFYVVLSMYHHSISV